MKRVFIVGAMLALLVPACAFAQSVFDGSWTRRRCTMPTIRTSCQ